MPINLLRRQCLSRVILLHSLCHIMVQAPRMPRIARTNFHRATTNHIRPRQMRKALQAMHTMEAATSHLQYKQTLMHRRPEAHLWNQFVTMYRYRIILVIHCPNPDRSSCHSPRQLHINGRQPKLRWRIFPTKLQGNSPALKTPRCPGSLYKTAAQATHFPQRMRLQDISACTPKLPTTKDVEHFDMAQTVPRGC